MDHLDDIGSVSFEAFPKDNSTRSACVMPLPPSQNAAHPRRVTFLSGDGEVTLEQLALQLLPHFLPPEAWQPRLWTRSCIKLDKDVPRVGSLQKCLQSTPP